MIKINNFLLIFIVISIVFMILNQNNIKKSVNNQIQLNNSLKTKLDSISIKQELVNENYLIHKSKLDSIDLLLSKQINSDLDKSKELVNDIKKIIQNEEKEIKNINLDSLINDINNTN